MPKPVIEESKKLSRKEADDLRREFEKSDLANRLNQLGVPIEVHDHHLTNARRLGNIQRDGWNDQSKWNYSIIGRTLYEKQWNEISRRTGRKKNDKQWKAHRLLMKNNKNLIEYFRDNGHDGRAFWMDKELEGYGESKGRTETAGMAETLNRFCNPSIVKDFNSSGIEDHLRAVLERWQRILSGKVFIDWEQHDEWISKMNWNRNSGWPYHMPISEERYRSKDQGRFMPWLELLARAASVEEVEAIMGTSPPLAKNTNRNIDIMFNRKPDRVIWGIELLMKIPGAFFSKNTTSNMPDSGIGWFSIDKFFNDMSGVLAHDDVMLGAEDFIKYDSNIPRAAFDLCYNILKESDFLEHQPIMRNMLLAMFYVFTKDATLYVSPFHTVQQLRGLRSGHPLTQWFGSWLHLALGDRWREMFGCDWEYENVLSDDAIRALRGVTLEEMDRLIKTDMAEDVKQFGLEFHPKKTIVCDPNANQVSLGYHTRLEREVMVGDSLFYLKQMAAADTAGSFGNTIGVGNSLIQAERTISNEMKDRLLPNFIVEPDLYLGDNEKPLIEDVSRMVDIIASCGEGNPLYDHHLDFVRNAWPDWTKRGVRILEHKLTEEWRMGSTYYAGGTLESGIHRQSVVEDLLTPADEYSVRWENQSF